MLILRRPLMLVLLLAGVSTLTAPVARAADAPDRSTTVASPARIVGTFRALTVRAPVDVRLRQSGHEAVEVLADEQVQPLIETRVIDGKYGPTLEIALRKNARLPATAHVVVNVDFVDLRALGIEGSGDVSTSGLRTGEFGVAIAGSGVAHIGGLHADSLSIAIAGSGDVDVSGQAAQVSARISGSGGIDAERLAADTVSVKIAGSGDASVQATKTLDVSISGSGDVTYRGEAKVSSAIAGNGTVTRR